MRKKSSTTRAARHGKPYDPRRRRLQNVLVGLAGIVGLLAGAALLIGVLPRLVAEERAFVAAPECRGTRADDCLWSASFTVKSLTLQRGKSESGRAEVVGTAQEGAFHVRFNGISSFLERTQPGDEVTGTLWKGRIVALADAEGGQRTAAHPVGDSLIGVMFGLVLLVAGGLGSYAAWWWLRHPESSTRRHPAALVRAAWAGGLLCAYAFALLFVLSRQDLGPSAFLAFWAPAFCAAAAFLLWPRRGLRHQT